LRKARGETYRKREMIPETQLYSSRFVERNFDALRGAAIEDLTRYSCGWSVYSINFLNAVAELQGVASRMEPHVISALRRDAKRIRNPGLAKLMRRADTPRSMKIEEIMTLISAELPERSR
jgi:hypothetical protein